MTSRFAALLLATTAACAAGCGGSSPSAAASPDGGSAQGIDASSPDGFCSAFFSIAGDTLVRCNGAYAAGVQALYSDPLPCQRFASSIAAGRTRFDSSGAAACLAALMSATCDGTSMQGSACAGVITPLVATGGACSSYYLLNLSNECVGDAFCREAPNLGCAGTCTMRSPVGASCDPFSASVRCTTNATCDFGTKVCAVAPVAVGSGQPCGGTGQGPCQGGLYCDRSARDGGASGVCHAKKPSGPCTGSDECAQPLHCAGATSAKSCATVKPVGASCTTGWGECGLFGYCQGGRCTDVPSALGQPCGSLGGEAVDCAPGAYCDTVPLGTGACRAQKPSGQACTGAPAATECAGNNGHCDSSTHACTTCTP